MPQQKLTIVPVTLHTENKNTSTTKPDILSSNPTCTIKMATAEISFFTGIDEHIIQTVIRELINSTSFVILVFKCTWVVSVVIILKFTVTILVYLLTIMSIWFKTHIAFHPKYLKVKTLKGKSQSRFLYCAIFLAYLYLIKNL